MSEGGGKTIGIAKARRLQRLLGPDNRFYMVALDQRAILATMLAQFKQIDAAELPFSDLLRVKRLLVESLAQPCSAMLYDPNIAVPAAIDILPSDTGLVVSLEHHVVEESPAGRKTRSIPDWSVEKIHHLGADGVKLLIWYHPDAAAGVCRHQQDYVRSVGVTCEACGVPLVLELLAYKPGELQNQDSAEPAGTSAEFSAAELADVVVRSVLEFSKPEYRIDLFKLESPVPPATLNSTVVDVESTFQQAFDAVGRVCKEADIPWVLLSAGVTTKQFIRLLGYAYRAGASGFLAGRAIWKAPLSVFPDIDATRKALQSQGVDALQQIIQVTQRQACPVAVNNMAYVAEEVAAESNPAGKPSESLIVVSHEGAFAKNYP